MNPETGRRIELSDFNPGRGRFLAESISGLEKPQKELPCKYFYDERGASLYESICTLEEYYIPRTEAAIMETRVREMAGIIGPNALLIEYGSGSCAKTRLLLDNLSNPAAYVPVDISREQLLRAAQQIAADYPGLEVLPVCADYTGDFRLPVPGRPVDNIAAYFPGSTIGNFDPVSAGVFLKHIAAVCGRGGGLLIGVDLKKDADVLNRAYNDRRGVTAAFNLNVLERINRELGGDFRVDYFEHRAFYNSREGRVEMHLVSRKNQTVRLDGVTIPFADGESIWTESSYKFNLNEFERMAAAAGFRVEQVWTDERHWFSVQYLVNTIGMTA
ncbi:L-histidine N(alpha)-methyltransferase [Chloroflexota bacterium]